MINDLAKWLRVGGDCIGGTRRAKEGSPAQKRADYEAGRDMVRAAD